MASISSLTNSSAISNKGIGGLATGLNTDDLVDALISGTKSKIAKQGQQKQLLNWKMTAYRSMATALSAFQAKSLKSSSAGSKTNITSGDFFNTFKATSSSSKVSVSTTSKSATGNFTINKITQLAEAESYTSVKKLSATLSTDIDPSKTYEKDAFSGKTLSLKATGFADKTIKLDDLNEFIDSNGKIDLTMTNADGQKFEDKLQSLIDKAYNGSKVVDVSTQNGQIVLDSSSARLTVVSGNSPLGLSAGDTNRVTVESKLGSLDAFKGLQGDTMTFKINGYEISVNKNETIKQLQTKIANSGANVSLEYNEHSDEFKLVSKEMGSDAKIEMQDLHGNLLNEIFGAQGGNGIGTGYLVTGNSFTSLNKNTIDNMTDAERRKLVDDLDGMSFDMTVNGVTRTVKLNVMLGISADQRKTGKYTSEEVYKSINEGIQSAFYNSGIEFTGDKDGHTVIKTPNGDAINATFKGQLADLLGTGSNMTNIVSDYGYSKTIATKDTNITPASLGLTQDNPSAEFEMTINGVTKTIKVSLDERDPTEEEKAAPDFDPDKKYYNEINGEVFVARLNGAIKSAFGADAVSFSADYVFSKQSVADNKVFGEGATFDPAQGVLNKDGQVVGQLVTGEDLDKLLNGAELPEGVYAISYEGDDGKTYYNRVDSQGFFVNEKGDRIDNKNNIIEMKLTLNTNDTGKVATKSVELSGAFVEKLGFNGTTASNATSVGVKLNEILGASSMGSGTLTFVLGETEAGDPITSTVAYGANDSLQDFLKKVNEALGDSGSAGLRDGKLYIESSGKELHITDNNKENGVLKNIFGINGGEYKTAEATFKAYDEETGTGTFRAGKNAEYEINGVKMWWSSNTISYNDVNITLNEVSLDEEIKINVQADPDDVVKRLQEWMDDYNALVFTLNSTLNESKNKEYTPLTDEQKAEMTEDQIKTWETEAKKGILRNDQALRGILSDMRSALYEKVESAGISLFDIGIVTKSGLSDPNEAGQLEFDKNISGGGEERLRQMLTENPDKVRMLFTDSDYGIGNKLNNIINRAVETSSIAEKRGTLVRLAGTDKITGDNTSQIGNKISAIDTYITALKARMESEYNRYWKKFSALETAVQKMNTQSSWLQSQ